MQKTYTLLCLGDSYTIGESVTITHSFPYQTVQYLRKNWNVGAPEIIAKTGWTTDELAAALVHYKFPPQYDFVTLLVGVNDQYRGRMVEAYKMEFEGLVKSAILLTGGKPDHVIVLSIPDYSVTPYAHLMNREKIGTELSLFNSVNKALSIQYKTAYIDLTESSREAAADETFIAEDKLHYSKKEYARWSLKIAEVADRYIKNK